MKNIYIHIHIYINDNFHSHYIINVLVHELRYFKN
jgi:hypothetical protein